MMEVVFHDIANVTLSCQLQGPLKHMNQKQRITLKQVIPIPPPQEKVLVSPGVQQL